ncbi:PREDICTED: guanine nucleotide exchange factor MSS4-like [Elephantulus edwardii]|uniref:guanine nucleotide exchange factor MSS4-like n=1 Tax=Elephantulus edwardii TaxID=28737 RepID=UPI0003F0624F|nr:PREDICTED: guanine nucleotide exchange factor MSS4-like [Elephantulus edwardii]
MEAVEQLNELVSPRIECRRRIRKAMPCQHYLWLLSAIALFCQQLFPLSKRKKPGLADGNNPDGNLLREHWMVNRMFIFENVDFPKCTGNIKVVGCMYYETGPNGWHCLDDKMFVA